MILRKSGACYLLMHEGRAVSKELDDLIADNERLQLSRTKVRATVEIEGEDTPALVAEWIGVQIVA